MELIRGVELDRLKELVSEGGGVWVGIQEAFTNKDESLVLFNSPFTKSTLAIPVRLMSAGAVELKISASNKTFKTRPDFITISKPNAKMFVTKLRELADLFEQLTQENKNV